MSKITPEARERCSRKSFHDQLEDARKEMQRESGSKDMADIDQAIAADAWGGHHARLVMPVEGAD